MKKILATTVYNLISSAIILGFWLLFKMPILVALFCYVTLNATMFLTLVLSEYFTIKNIKTLFKRLWFWVRFKRVEEIHYLSCIGCCLYGTEERNKCFTNGRIKKCSDTYTIVSKRSYKRLNWLKKLFGILVIALLFASCSVYVNCNFNKVPKYKTTQQDSTVLQINEYWF